MTMRLCFVAGAAAAVIQPAVAQEVITLDPIILEASEQLTGGPIGPTIASDSVTASKTGASILETPRSITVVTEQRMADQGARTVQDALVYSAGVYGAAYGFDTRGDWSRVRGLEPEEYRDGLKWHFGYYNNTRPHPYTLERVEVLKGPASVLYGAGSPGGIVNVAGKMPQEEARREAFVEYGTHDWKQVGVDVTGSADSKGTFLYRFVGVWRDSDTQVDHVSDDVYALSPSFTWRPTDDTSLTAHFNLQRNESGSSTQFLPWEGTVFPAPNGQIPTNRFVSEPGWDRYDTKQAAVTAIFDHRFNDVWSISARTRYSKSSADYDTMYPAFPPKINSDGRTIDRVAYMSDASARSFTADVHVNAGFATGGARHKLAFGIDYQRATTENDYFYGSGGTIDLYDPVYGNLPTDLPYYDFDPARTRQTGFYVQDQISFGGGWTASLGLRRDIAKDASGHTDRVWSKDLGLMYEFDSGIVPYISYSESFLPIADVDFHGNPYKPERGKQYEAGVKYQPTGTPSLYTASIFEIEKENLLTADPNNPLNQIQIGEARIRGIELEAQASWSEFELLAGYTYLDTESETGFRLDTVPEHMASAWATYRPQGKWEGFKAGLGLRYVGKTWDGVDEIHTDPYLLADAMIGYETEDWALTLTGRNLSDKVHITSCLARGDCFYGDRRSVALNFTSKF